MARACRRCLRTYQRRIHEGAARSSIEHDMRSTCFHSIALALSTPCLLCSGRPACGLICSLDGQGKMPASKVQRVHNAVGAVKAERLRITWHPAAVQHVQLLPPTAQRPGVVPGQERGEEGERTQREEVRSRGVAVMGEAEAGAEEEGEWGSGAAAAGCKTQPAQEKK